VSVFTLTDIGNRESLFGLSLTGKSFLRLGVFLRNHSRKAFVYNRRQALCVYKLLIDKQLYVFGVLSPHTGIAVAFIDMITGIVL